MTKDRPRNVAASVRQRLMNIARQQREAFDLVLVRYALERLLFRLSNSQYRQQFVLKGAMLFRIWSDQLHRPTRDLDLLGYGAASPPDFANMFREICDQGVEDDGLSFAAETVSAETIKEAEKHPGLRLKLLAHLASARIPIQIDLGFGDIITPGVLEITYPTLLNFAAPVVGAYPRETVVAEKYHAMAKLGIANSRMKDFYDIWTLAREFAFSGSVLCTAIQATFECRETALPVQPPLALTTEFSEDRQKLAQWQAFVRKGKLDVNEAGFREVVQRLRMFLWPPTEFAVRAADFPKQWPPGGPWG